MELKLISDDAIYRDDEGTEHRVEWVTQRDLELARRISEVARDQGLSADPASLTAIELALDTAHAAAVAPVWSALLTGGAEAQGRGTIGDDVATSPGECRSCGYQDKDEHETPHRSASSRNQVPYDVAEASALAAAVAAGAWDRRNQAPGTTVLADQDATGCTHLRPAIVAAPSPEDREHAPPDGGDAVEAFFHRRRRRTRRIRAAGPSDSNQN